MTTLDEVWEQQYSYNDKVRSIKQRTPQEWMIDYILGAHSELSEILDETKWKSHRTQIGSDYGSNIIEELADLTKYVFSMWQLLGFHHEDMLYEVYNKGLSLEGIFDQEQKPLVTGRSVIILDLDGVVANFPKGFLEWLRITKGVATEYLPEESIHFHIDINKKWGYSEYRKYKEEFERVGGYQTLPTIDYVCKAVREIQAEGYYVIAYTARPFPALKRVWLDTFLWLQHNNLKVDELRFGYEDRIAFSQHLQKGNFVVAMEDDPTLIQRFTNSRIPVMRVVHKYNVMIQSPHIVGDIFDHLTAEQIKDMVMTL